MESKSLPDGLVGDQFVKHSQAVSISFSEYIVFTNDELPVELCEHFADKRVLITTLVCNTIRGCTFDFIAVKNLSYVDLKIEILLRIFFKLKRKLEEILITGAGNERMERGVKVSEFHRLSKRTTFLFEAVLDFINQIQALKIRK